MAIVIMLFVALALIGVLGWQSIQTQRSHYETAQTVLREYAILAADELGRRAVASLGYEGYYSVITRVAGPGSADAMRAAIEGDESLKQASVLANAYFLWRADSTDVSGPALPASVQELLAAALEQPVPIDSPYLSRRTEDGRAQVVFAHRLGRQGLPELAGFLVNDEGIRLFLEKAIDRGPLLPASLAGGAVNNDMLFARVTDPSGTVVLELNPQFDSYLTVTRILGNEYQGIVENFTVEVSLDPDSAGSLVIGGLPGSRLPLLVFAMILVIALLVAAIWLFRREQAVMKLRSDFVSQVSHELRTPLTQIRMFAETLLMDRARNDGERLRSLEIINRESQRLSHLVDNILRFSNGPGSKQVDLREQAIAPILSEVCESVQATNDSVRIHLQADERIMAIVDADALRQIVLNLLDNAIKYGPADQLISVSLDSADQAVLLCIEDQGSGIPESEHQRVFLPFYRMRREEKAAISGTGIGLAIVKELAENMGGRCFIDHGHAGAKFCIELTGATAHG